MVDVNNGYKLSAEFAACDDRTMAWNIDAIESYNRGTAFDPRIFAFKDIIDPENPNFTEEELEKESLGFEGEYHEMPGPSGPYMSLEDLAKIYEGDRADLDKLFEEMPDLQERLDEIVKDLPYCGPALIGQVVKPLEPFA